MRYLWLSLIVLLTVVLVLFTLQNLGQVRLRFLAAEGGMPLSLLLVLVYGLGMITGGGLVALLRRSWRGAKAPVTTERPTDL